MSDTICICKTCNHKHEWESRRQGDYCTYCPNCDDPMYDQVPRIEVPTTHLPELKAEQLELIADEDFSEIVSCRQCQFVHSKNERYSTQACPKCGCIYYYPHSICGKMAVNSQRMADHYASQLHSLRSRLDEANKPFVDADSRIQIIQNDNTFSYKAGSLLKLGFNTWREAYRAGEDYLNQIEAAKVADSLRSELATAKERIGELEKNEDIWSRRLAEATEERRSLQAAVESEGLVTQSVSEYVRKLEEEGKACRSTITTLQSRLEAAEGENVAMRACIGLDQKERVVRGEPGALTILRHGNQISISPTNAVVEKLEMDWSAAQSRAQQAEEMRDRVTTILESGELGKACVHWMRAYDSIKASDANPENCQIIRIPKDLIPKGAKLVEAYETEKQYIIIGQPESDDESHNCDAMGCSTLSHVVARIDKSTSPSSGRTDGERLDQQTSKDKGGPNA